MNRIFVELPLFRKLIDALEDGTTLLKEIQSSLLKNPELGDVIVGTGGLRKMRHAGKGRGKSGGYRVTYLHRPELEKVYLLVIYSKNEKEDLNSNERKILKKLVMALKCED